MFFGNFSSLLGHTRPFFNIIYTEIRYGRIKIILKQDSEFEQLLSDRVTEIDPEKCVVCGVVLALGEKKYIALRTGVMGC